MESLGAVGVVTDAISKDTDEIEIEKVPLYLRKKGRGIRPGRNEIESVNRPVVIGSVLVCRVMELLLFHETLPSRLLFMLVKY